MNISAILLGGGSGKRLGADENKIFVCLLHKPILAYSLELLDKHNSIKEIIVVTAIGEDERCRQIVNAAGIKKPVKYINGGKERTHSVANGLSKVSADMDLVMIHDGARPLLTELDLDNLIDNFSACDDNVSGAILATPMKETIKEVRGTFVDRTLDRSNLWSVKTPQLFRTDILIDYYKKAINEQIVTTDDASIMEHYKEKVLIVSGSDENIKVTTPIDLTLAEIIMSRRQSQCE